jgi:hypothetical protein
MVNNKFTKIIFLLFIIYMTVNCSGRKELWITNPPVIARSTDEQKIAWVQQVEDKNEVWEENTVSKTRAVAVNGELLPGAYAGISTIVISPDASSLAYPALLDTMWIMVVDGKETGPACNEISINWITFSTNGEHLSYGAEIGDRLYMIADGEIVEKEGHDKTGFPVFSADGSRFAYVAENNNRQYIIENGQNSQFYDEVVDPVFSPDGKHFAYTASKNGKSFAVIDDQIMEAGDETGKVLFSADSRNYAYSIRKGENWYVIKNGKKSGSNYTMLPQNLVFAEGDSRLAFSAYSGKSWMVVIDGDEGPEHMDVVADSLRLSPDGKGFAYIASDGRGWYVMKDGKPGQGWDNIVLALQPYTRDGRNFVYAARLNMKWQIVANNVPGAILDLDEIKQQNGPVYSDNEKYISYTARKGDKWHIFVNGISGPGYDRVYKPAFVADGVKYLAEDNKRNIFLQCLQAYPASGSVKSENLAVVETILSAIPQIPLTEEECAPCKLERQSMSADELLELGREKKDENIPETE